MAPTEFACLLGAVVLIAILLTAVIYRFASGGGDGKTETYMPGDGAAPKVREAVAAVSVELRTVGAVAAQYEELGDRISKVLLPPGDALEDAQKRQNALREGVRVVAQNIGSLGATIEAMPPTHGNALSLYRGVRDSRGLEATAKNIARAGAELARLAGEGENDSSSETLGADLAAAGSKLGQLSSCVRTLVWSTHNLGWALQLE